MDTNTSTNVQSMSAEEMLQSVGAVQMLLDDHVEIKSLLDRLTKAEAADRLRCVESLKQILVVHNATEENLIYPALHVSAGEQFEPRKLYVETAEADMLLFQLDQLAKGLDHDDFAAKAEKFAGAVREHIDSEEKSAFPHLRDKVDAGRLAHLDQDVREFRGKLRFGSSTMAGQLRTRTGTM